MTLIFFFSHLLNSKGAKKEIPASFAIPRNRSQQVARVILNLINRKNYLLYLFIN